MANFRKSFNFRDGVQVDDDNLLVNANGLVGIGTTVPTELLDVRGNAVVSGVTSSTNVYIVDGLEVDPAGIATIGSAEIKDINVTGVLTASQFKIGSSEVVDNLIGYARTTFLTDNGGVGLHTTSKLGVNTTTSPVATDPALNVYGNVIVRVGSGGTGIVTATRFDGDIDASKLFTGTVSNDRLPAAISVTSVTAPSLVGIATTARGLIGTPTITVQDLTVDGNATITGLSTFNDSVDINGSADVSGFLGARGFAVQDIVSTASTTTFLRVKGGNGNVAIGTDTTSTDFTLKRTNSVAEIEIVSTGSNAQVSIGQSHSGGNDSSLIRHKDNKFEFINYDVGSIDTILHDGAAGLSTGNFRWIYGQNNANLMTLTYEGNLGINDTSPEHKLSVGGISTFTGAAYFNDNVTFEQNVTVDGILTANISLGTQVLTNNIAPASGISTLQQLKVSQGMTVAGGIGIGTTSAARTGDDGIDCVDRTGLFGSIGIGTTAARSHVDFGALGDNTAANAHVILPMLTNAQRANLTPVAGSLIYNMTVNKLQFYNGSAWETVTSST